MLELTPLTESNFADYEALTRAESNGKTGCYCAFWHQRFTSGEAWEARQREAPELNRQAMLARVRGGFHVGVLGYDDGTPVAWLSVSPLIEVYWAWRRVAALGLEAAKTAGITCVNLAPGRRGQGLQIDVLEALAEYGRTAGWSALEGYPFEPAAFEKHGESVAWPGTPAGFAAAGFTPVGPHWIAHPDWPRVIVRRAL